MSSNICSIVASFIAYGVLHLRGTLGRAGWQYVFRLLHSFVYLVLLQFNQVVVLNRVSQDCQYYNYIPLIGCISTRGLITLIIGIATFFMMPPSPTQTRKWYRPNGWFTEREETIIVSRVLRDDPTKVAFLTSSVSTHFYTQVCIG